MRSELRQRDSGCMLPCMISLGIQPPGWMFAGFGDTDPGATTASYIRSI